MGGVRGLFQGRRPSFYAAYAARTQFLRLGSGHNHSVPNASPAGYYCYDKVLTAYLILAHHQPNHLARLIETLDSADCAFFIQTIRFSSSWLERNRTSFSSSRGAM